MRTRRLVAELPEADDDTHLGERGELALEERRAGIAFVGERRVPGWCALDGGGDPGVAQGQAIVESLAQTGIETSWDREIIAMIAYLQRLGRDGNAVFQAEGSQ